MILKHADNYDKICKSLYTIILSLHAKIKNVNRTHLGHHVWYLAAIHDVNSVAVEYDDL